MILRENEVGRRLVPFLCADDRVLDYGGGTGRISLYLKRRVGVEPFLTDLVDYRRTGLPFLLQTDPFSVPVPDSSFDVVLLLFVLHHVPVYEDQLRVLREARRISRSRVLLIEDTPFSAVDLAMNIAWDWILNIRHGVPKPFTFRSADKWVEVFGSEGLRVTHQETYRPRWPTLGMYHHTFFALELA